MIAQKISKKFHEIFDDQVIKQIARETEFEKREPRKMTSVEFLKLLVFSNLNTKDISLDNLCEQFEIENFESFSKQSLDEKFDLESVEFIKKILEQVIKQTVIENFQNSGTILDNFESVRIKDSTCYKLSGNLSETYKASSKNTEQSIIKIQYEYDLKTGTVYDLSLHSFIEADFTDAILNIENINKDVLYLRDLGYVVLSVMASIIEKGAYFLNRFDFTSNAYETETSTTKIDFSEIQKYLKKHQLKFIEKNVFIGDKDRIPVRMIIDLLPESEVQKRLKNLKRRESQNGKKYSKSYKDRQMINVYVTNIPQEKLDTENVRQIYRLRWQIELLFKAWKSIGKIEKTKKMKIERFETMLYAKLILLLLCQQVYWETTQNTERYDNKPLSIYKTIKTLINNLKEIKIAIKQGLESINSLFRVLIKIIRKKCRLEKKKNSISSKEIMCLKNEKNNEK